MNDLIKYLLSFNKCDPYNSVIVVVTIVHLYSKQLFSVFSKNYLTFKVYTKGPI